MSSTRSNKFLSTRYLEYRLEEGPNDNGDTLSYFQNPFQFSFLVLPNQDPTSLPGDPTELDILTLPTSNYNTCVWRLSVYNPIIYDVLGIVQVTYKAHVRSGTIHFDGQNSTSPQNFNLNTHPDVFHPNVICDAPPVGTEYPPNSYNLIQTIGTNTLLVASYNSDASNINIVLSGWLPQGRVKGHLTIF